MIVFIQERQQLSQIWRGIIGGVLKFDSCNLLGGENNIPISNFFWKVDDNSNLLLIPFSLSSFPEDIIFIKIE